LEDPLGLSLDDRAKLVAIYVKRREGASKEAADVKEEVDRLKAEVNKLRFEEAVRRNDLVEAEKEEKAVTEKLEGVKARIAELTAELVNLGDEVEG
jgi:chromosome segregation ATPase